MVGLVGVEARVQVRARAGREVTSAIQEMFKSVKPCSRDVQESHAMFERESFATGALFKTVQLGPARRRLVESDCPYGAEPRPCPGLLGWTKSSVISHALLGSINLPIFIHV